MPMPNLRCVVKLRCGRSFQSGLFRWAVHAIASAVKRLRSNALVGGSRKVSIELTLLQTGERHCISAVAFMVAGGGFEPPTFGLCDLTHLSMRVGLYLHPRGAARHSVSTPSPTILG